MVGCGSYPTDSLHVTRPSSGFSCCYTLDPSQGYHPLCVQPRFHHRRVPTMVWDSIPLCCTSGGWRLLPTGLPLCLAFKPGLHLIQLIERQALLQCHYPLSCIGSFFSRVFVNPMQSALAPGWSMERWFSCICVITGPPQGMEQDGVTT